MFDTYWRFAAKRQAMYEARLHGRLAPWTDDPILRAHRFTNCYRASDRVSQYLLQSVIYSGSQSRDDLVFRTLLFKLFNKVSTWELLSSQVGDPMWASFDLDDYDRVLSAAFAEGQRLYSAAYVMPPPRLAAERKHTNHLLLLQLKMNDRLPERLASCDSMQGARVVVGWHPCLCVEGRAGHRTYYCRTCGVTMYVPPHEDVTTPRP